MSWRARLPTKVRETVDVVLAHPPAQIVFDADGTLWRGDVGEDFLRFAAARQLVRGKAEGLFARYEALHAHDAPTAYAFCAEVFGGCEHAALQSAATTFFADRFVGRVFSYVRPFIRAAHDAGHEVWVCSASPAFIVEPGAAHLGVPSERVIAVWNEREAELLAARIVPPVPAGPGKVEWLRRRNVKPLLAIGNGSIDVDMLAFATHAIAVGPHDAETPLTREAAARAWPILKV